jgi:hypothetical protein
MHLDDFGLPACRLIFEAARRYYLVYKRLPPFSTLEIEVMRAIHDQTGEIETRLSPVEVEPLAIVMGWIAQARQSELDPEYFAKSLSEFLMNVRMALIPTDQSPIQYAAAVQAMTQKIASSGGAEFEFTDGRTPVPFDKGSARPRLGFGVKSIDSMIGGGLCRGQIGMIVACTGVGKTVAMVNILMSAMRAGKHALFLTFELSEARIRERFQTMLACVDAGWFKKPRSAWPADVLTRWGYVTGSEFQSVGSFTVLHMSGPSTTEIDRSIYAWRQYITNKYGSDEECAIVAVDWLDRISTAGLSRMNRQSSDERGFFWILDDLDKIKTKHDIILWTATQGAKNAKGKEVLTTKDTAWGDSKNHLMDLSLAIAPMRDLNKVKAEQLMAFDPTVPTDDESLNQDSAIEPPCDRQLMISYLKTRDSSAADMHRSIYQGPSLRFWNDRRQALSSSSVPIERYYG